MSHIALSQVEEGLRDGREEIVTKEVETRILPVSWMFNSQPNQKSGFNSFIRSLRDVEYDRIFGLEMTKFLVESVWPDYQRQVLARVFLPFVIDLFVVHVYFILLCD